MRPRVLAMGVGVALAVFLSLQGNLLLLQISNLKTGAEARRGAADAGTTSRIATTGGDSEKGEQTSEDGGRDAANERDSDRTSDSTAAETSRGAELPIRQVKVEQQDITAAHPAKIMFFCMQTKKAHAWCKMLHSASSNGIQVHHPNFGSSYKHAKRIGWVLTSIASLPPDTVVCFNDGTDVLFNGGAEEILRRFESMEAKWRKKIFFNAEKSCYAQQAFPTSCGGKCQWALRKAKCLTTYRNTVWRNGTADVPKWRYLNAGCFIGRVSAVREFFNEVAKITFKDSPANTQLRSGIWCDQSMITKVLLTQAAEGRSIAGLDVDNRVYLPTYHLHPSEDFCPSTGSLHTCHNRDHEGEEPLIFHLNGKSESALWNHKHGKDFNFVSDTKHSHYILGKQKSLASLCS
eukprot:TRINITY_DN13132_c0_g1_i1.p1 TRINITY_DN13132_c0_g1~~TRINITY_DN13132_c0_g1_i1.p1  ORF type:complete len:405 (+),score=64.22 TRINITY_DN13132_c0_g1_i1:201-1415(+)